MLLIVIFATLAAGASARTCTCGATWGGGEVNVRSCASTTCSILGAVSPGQCFDYQATEASVWYRMNFNGRTGYTHSDYMSNPHECGGGTYCTNNLCSSYSSNQKRGCDSYGCGNYGAGRGDRAHLGWDVRCNGAGATVYAPYAGTVTRRAYPYGDGSCCDTGFLIEGNGQFAGHAAMIFYCDPNRISIPSAVNKGQAVATHRGLHCGCYGSGMTDHVHYQLDYRGVRIDPASFLFC